MVILYPFHERVWPGAHRVLTSILGTIRLYSRRGNNAFPDCERLEKIGSRFLQLELNLVVAQRRDARNRGYLPVPYRGIVTQNARKAKDGSRGVEGSSVLEFDSLTQVENVVGARNLRPVHSQVRHDIALEVDRR